MLMMCYMYLSSDESRYFFLLKKSLLVSKLVYVSKYQHPSYIFHNFYYYMFPGEVSKSPVNITVFPLFPSLPPH